MKIFLLILAIVLFLVGLIYALTNDAPDATALWGFLFGGLASFAASFLPIPA